jgi:hypothetical protein
VPLASQQLHPKTDISTSHAEWVCLSVDIHNSIKVFQHLVGCHVAKSFVKIMFTDQGTDSSFSNLPFSDLHEITHLLLYCVSRLLFPSRHSSIVFYFS